MKKVLLTLTAFIATLTASAQWTASFEPVNDAAELKGIHTTTATDGSVYVSSTYNQGFTFAGKDVTDPEGLTSAAIVKYDAEGKELWAVTFEGAAVVNAIDTDADGTLYVAGNFTDVVKHTGADGVSAEMTSETVFSTFVTKINTEGKIEAVKVITPVVNEEIASKVGDPWDMGVDSPLYTMWDPIYVTPNKIQVDGDKVYISAKYMGDVISLGWKGSYIDMWGMMYSDNYSMGVFSLNKSDLMGEASVANVQMTGVIADTQFYPEAMSFVAENGTVYVGFIGFQNLTLTTANGSEDFTFAVSEDGGSNEHAFVLATIGETTTTKTFNAAAHDKLAVPYNLFMETDGENLIIGGTYHGALPFNNEITSGELASTPFMTSVKKADGTVNWAYTGEQETTATCMTFAENALIASENTEITSIDLVSGEAQTTTHTYAYCDADKNAAVCAEETKVHIFISAISTNIEGTVIEQESGIRYNLAGQAVDNNYKGTVIINGKVVIVK